MPTDVSIYNQIRQPEPLANQLTALAGARQADAAASAAQLELALRHLTATHSALGSLAANPNSTVDDAHRGLGDLVSAGVIPADQAQRFGGQIEALRNNPEGFRNFVRGHLLDLQDAHTRHVDAYGVPDVQDLGDNQLTRYLSPTSGVRNVAREAYTLKPEFKATRNITFQGGQPGTAPASSSVDEYGYARRPALPGPQAVAGGAAPAAMAPGGGFIPTGPSLGQTRVAEGGADMYVKDLQAAAGSSGELANLQAALGPLQGLGATGTGPGVAGRGRIASALQAVGLGSLPGVDPKKIEDLDEAAAYLGSAARSGALSPGGGQAIGTGAPTTPNLDISQPAAVNLVRAQIGLKRFQQAQARSYAGQDNGAGYASHAATFATEQDPRAYSVDLRTPAEKQKLMQSLGPPGSPAYQKFVRSLKTAHDLRLMNAAGQ